MRALVLGGLLAVMCVCLLKADLIYIYIHRQWASTLSKTLVLSMTPPKRAPTADNCILHFQPGKGAAAANAPHR
jgi:hypothetical protein